MLVPSAYAVHWHVNFTWILKARVAFKPACFVDLTASFTLPSALINIARNTITLAVSLSIAFSLIAFLLTACTLAAFTLSAFTLSLVRSLMPPLGLQAVGLRSLLVKRRNPWRMPWRIPWGQLGTWRLPRGVSKLYDRWKGWCRLIGNVGILRALQSVLLSVLLSAPRRCPRLQLFPRLAALRLAVPPLGGPRLAASRIRGPLLFFSALFYPLDERIVCLTPLLDEKCHLAPSQ